MQCPHCANPDSILYGTSRGVQRYRYKPADGSFKRYDQGKGPALKQGLLTLSRRDRDASDP